MLSVYLINSFFSKCPANKQVLGRGGRSCERDVCYSIDIPAYREADDIMQCTYFDDTFLSLQVIMGFVVGVGGQPPLRVRLFPLADVGNLGK